MIKHQKLFIVILLTLSGLCGLILSLYHHLHQPPPVPIIQTFHYPATFINQLKGDPQAGEKIFKEFCRTCHDKKPLIDIKAPHIGDKHFWRSFKNGGTAILLKMTIKGVGAMPARGGCFECSDEQLRETIQYILDNS